MTATRRALAWMALLALIAACGMAAPDEETESSQAEAVAPSVPTPAMMPTLDPTPTGPASADPNVTIDRCVATGWSYTGCDTTYPTQGRQYVAWACQSGPEANRPILCARWSQYRIVGIGGPVERQAGLDTLDTYCNQDHRISCTELADHLLFEDLPRARVAAARGCDVDPRNSPMGHCETLHQVLSDEAVRRTATVTSATGLAGLAVGGQCRTWVTGSGTQCEGYVECAGNVLWGRGGSYFPCEWSGRDVSGGEDMVTRQDGDGAFRVDTAARTLEVRDDADGPLGAFEVRARLDE